MGQFRYLKRPGGRAARSYSASLQRSVGYRGRYECELIAWTPLEAGGVADVLDGAGKSRVGARKKQRQPKKGAAPQEFKPFNVDPVRIPGTGLKGMIRALAEFVGEGCYRVHDWKKVGNLPAGWEACSEAHRICVCCDMFGGTFGKKGGLRGKVRIGDGKLDGEGNLAAERELVAERHSPKHPRKPPAGPVQKFFLHEPWDPVPWRNRRGNASFFPVKPGVRFRFSVDFDGLDARELALLDWCLFLQPGLLHKLGKGKALGLGSVGIRCLSQEIKEMPRALADESARWSWKRGEEAAEVLQDPVEERLGKIGNVLEKRREIEKRKDLEDLREVMRWPGVAEDEAVPLPAVRDGDVPEKLKQEELEVDALVKVWNPGSATMEVVHGGETFHGEGEWLSRFVKGLSAGQEKKRKKGQLRVEVRLFREGNKRRILAIRLKGTTEWFRPDGG